VKPYGGSPGLHLVAWILSNPANVGSARVKGDLVSGPRSEFEVGGPPVTSGRADQDLSRADAGPRQWAGSIVNRSYDFSVHNVPCI
jgi:hypothetical protein